MAIERVLNLAELNGSDGFAIEGIDVSGYAYSNYTNYRVSDAGDVNGDGFDDVAIGFADISTTGTFTDVTNASYVVFGSATGFTNGLDLQSLNSSSGFVVRGDDSGTGSGVSISSAGDVNGDGVDDLIVGDNSDDPNGEDSGAGYVIFGDRAGFGSEVVLADLNGRNGFALAGIDAGDRTGLSVDSAGDINNDGIDDLVVSAFAADPNGESSGESYVVFGSTSGFESTFQLSALDGSNGFILNGINPGDKSGAVVAGAGDINGDGIDDLAISTDIGVVPNSDDNPIESYVVFGSESGFARELELSSLDGSNGFTISSSASLFLRGPIGGAGDINGDGIGDLIVSGSVDPGVNSNNRPVYDASYVVFGSASGFGSQLDLSSLDGSNGFTLSSEGVDQSVSSVGDFNGDGISDVIIGLQSISGDDNSYVVFGSNTGFESSLDLADLYRQDGLVIVDTSAASSAGVSVSGAGDFNGDGLDDVIIGSALARSFSGYDTSGNNEIYVVFGQQASEGAIAQNDTATTDEISAVTGNVLSNDTSANADRVDNLSISAVNGVATVVGNSTTLDSGARLTLNADGTFSYDPNGQFERVNSGSFGTDEFSYTVTDGVASDTATVEVTVNGITNPPTETSPAFNLDNLDGSNGFVVNNVAAVNSNQSVSNLGDINGDGIDDVIAANAVVFGSQAGFSGSLSPAELDGSNGFTLTGSISTNDGTYDIVSTSGVVSGAGDINDDGLDDFVVGFPGFAGFATEGIAGRSYVVFGRGDGFNSELDLSSLDETDGFVIQSNSESDQFGAAVSGAGDINGDGIDDLVIGAPSRAPFGGDTGKSYVVFGSGQGFGSGLTLDDLDGSNGFVLEGIDRTRYDGDRAGYSVSGAGDINGDGIADVIIGAPGASPGGESYVVFGSDQGFDSALDLANLNGNDGFILNGIESSAVAGTSVSSAGDINNDGINDVIIGAPGASPGGNQSGAGYVVFGNAQGFGRSFDLANLNGSNGFSIAGINRADGVGTSVSSAGDVNGDGIDDLIVGSGSTDFNNNSPGDSYIIYGSEAKFSNSLSLVNLSSRDGLTIAGAGRSVSGAGDVNGDGSADLIVGDREVDTDGSRSGKSYVVFGPPGTSTPNPPTVNPTVTTPLNPVSGGTAGNDGITGTDAADLLEGLAGNDVLSGGSGNDALDGGEGTDTALYQFDPAGVLVDLAGGSATDGWGDTDALVSIENVIGSDFDDAIAGDENNNNLTGRAGNDTIEGGLGDDTLLGGEGADTLIGGSGADKFLYVSVAEGGDAIADFETGTDKLLIVGAVFGGDLTAGGLTNEQFFTGFEATLGAQRFGYNSNTGDVLFDADGGGGADAQAIATLSGTPGFSNADITIL